MRLLGVGDNVVDCYLDLGRMFPGGNALNAAVAARRAGAEAAYLGALGDDEAGRIILRALQAEDVQTERVRVVHGSNARAWVRLSEAERLFMGSDRGVARVVMTAADLEYAGMFDVIHTSNFSYLEDQLADLAATRRCLSFDFSTRREPDYVASLLPFIGIAWFSASGLDDKDTLGLLQAATSCGPRLAVATRGSADALVHDGRHTWRQPVIASTRVIDTLGAGDAFIGRFLVGFARGEEVAISLRAAAEAAAITCSSYGAFGHGVPIEMGPQGTGVSPRGAEGERTYYAQRW
jgi:fructoselysine 6-kinase